MPDFFEVVDIVKDKFIFVSYSHKDVAVFEEISEFLVSEGVRLFTDKAFCPGDKWEELARYLIMHDNCSAIIWLCSEHSIKSDAVRKELSTALSEQKKRSSEKYPIFVVNVCSDNKPNSYISLLKKSFDLISGETVDFVFQYDMLKNLVKIIDGDPICVMTCEAEYLPAIYNAINKKVPGTIDKSNIILEEMQEISANNKNVFIDLGEYIFKDEKKPISWRLLRYEGEDAIFLSQEIIGVDLGGEYLTQWLNGEFRRNAFSQEESVMIKGQIGLLSRKEAQELSDDIKCKGCEWWLHDTRGSLQSIVRDDGSVYANGYNNKHFKKGIRPVMALTMEQAKQLKLNQSK